MTAKDVGDCKYSGSGIVQRESADVRRLFGLIGFQ